MDQITIDYEKIKENLKKCIIETNKVADNWRLYKSNTKRERLDLRQVFLQKMLNYLFKDDKNVSRDFKKIKAHIQVYEIIYINKITFEFDIDRLFLYKKEYIKNVIKAFDDINYNELINDREFESEEALIKFQNLYEIKNNSNLNFIKNIQF